MKTESNNNFGLNFFRQNRLISADLSGGGKTTPEVKLALITNPDIVPEPKKRRERMKEGGIDQKKGAVEGTKNKLEDAKKNLGKGLFDKEHKLKDYIEDIEKFKGNLRQYYDEHLPNTYGKPKDNRWPKWNKEFVKTVIKKEDVSKIEGRRYAKALQHFLKDYDPGAKDGFLGKKASEALGRYFGEGGEGKKKTNFEKNMEKYDPYHNEVNPNVMGLSKEEWETVKGYYWPYLKVLDVSKTLGDINTPSATSQVFAKTFHKFIKGIKDGGMDINVNRLASWRDAFSYAFDNGLLTSREEAQIHPFMLDDMTQEEYEAELKNPTKPEEVYTKPGDKVGDVEEIGEDAGVGGSISTLGLRDESKIPYLYRLHINPSYDHLEKLCGNFKARKEVPKNNAFSKIPTGPIKKAYSKYSTINTEWKQLWTEYKNTELTATEKSKKKKLIDDKYEERINAVDRLLSVVKETRDRKEEDIERFFDSHDMPDKFRPGTHISSAKDRLASALPKGVGVKDVFKIITRRKNKSKKFKNFGEVVGATYEKGRLAFEKKHSVSDVQKEVDIFNAAILLSNLEKYRKGFEGTNKYS